MKKYCFIVLNLLASCAMIPTRSHFADGRLTLNLDKQTVIERYGNPFSMDIYVDTDSVLKEYLYYKEAVRVKNCPFIVTTKLGFHNGKLYKMYQFDKIVGNVTLEVDTVKVEH